MYICKPERNVTQTKILIFACAAVTAVLFLISTCIESYAALVRFIAFAALTVWILLTVRYSLTELEYSVGGGSFSVTKITGNRRQTVCSIALETAIELMEKRDYDHLPSSEKAILKYSLNQNIKAKSYVFLCDFNGKRAMVEFEPNAEFVTILKEEIKLAKLNNNEE